LTESTVVKSWLRRKEGVGLSILLFGILTKAAIVERLGLLFSFLLPETSIVKRLLCWLLSLFLTETSIVE